MMDKDDDKWTNWTNDDDVGGRKTKGGSNGLKTQAEENLLNE